MSRGTGHSQHRWLCSVIVTGSPWAPPRPALPGHRSPLPGQSHEVAPGVTPCDKGEKFPLGDSQPEPSSAQSHWIHTWIHIPNSPRAPLPPSLPAPASQTPGAARTPSPEGEHRITTPRQVPQLLPSQLGGSLRTNVTHPVPLLPSSTCAIDLFPPKSPSTTDENQRRGKFPPSTWELLLILIKTSQGLMSCLNTAWAALCPLCLPSFPALYVHILEIEINSCFQMWEGKKSVPRGPF